MRLEVAGTFLDGPLARGETDKSQSLGAGNSKASTKKATAACQIEFRYGQLFMDEIPDAMIAK